ncbi:MAG: glycosyltransferase family 9 protein [Planctomycetota bacterium]
MMAVLILRSGAIGDVILTLPLAAACRERYGAVTLVIPGRMHGVARLCGFDHCLDIDTGGWHTLHATRPGPLPPALAGQVQALNLLEGPDGTVHANLTAAGIPVRSLAPPRNPVGMHAARYLLGVLGPPLSELPPVQIDPLRLPPLPRTAVAIFTHGRPVITIHPGTGSRRKLIGMEAWRAFVAHHCDRSRFIFLTGPADEDLAAAVGGLAGETGSVHLHAPALEEAAAVIHTSAAYIGLDSGITHLAGLTRTAVYAVFHATDPDTWRPPGPRVTVLTPADLAAIRIVD